MELGEETTPGHILSIWTVYDHPSDFPEVYVARRHEVWGDGSSRATSSVITSPDLELLRRALLSQGLGCITRSPQDDPTIVESWL